MHGRIGKGANYSFCTQEERKRNGGPLASGTTAQVVSSISGNDKKLVRLTTSNRGGGAQSDGSLWVADHVSVVESSPRLVEPPLESPLRAASDRGLSKTSFALSVGILLFRTLGVFLVF
jgi:hypothetical protein